MRAALVLTLVLAAWSGSSTAELPDAACPEPAARPAPPGVQGSEGRAYHADIIDIARGNTQDRSVVFTDPRMQIAVVSIPVAGAIGPETYASAEQIFFVVSGRGRAEVGGDASELRPGDVLVVPPATPHQIANDGDAPLQLYAVYTPPARLDGGSQATTTSVRPISAGGAMR